jgi:hypothetical protein
VSVPLFLPVYALKRRQDLDLLASSNITLWGLNVFHSGFEWAYWLHDVLYCATTYFYTHTPSASSAPPAPLTELARLLKGLHVLPAALVQLLVDLMAMEDEMFVRRGGVVFLQGADTWGELLVSAYTTHAFTHAHVRTYARTHGIHTRTHARTQAVMGTHEEPSPKAVPFSSINAKLDFLHSMADKLKATASKCASIILPLVPNPHPPSRRHVYATTSPAPFLSEICDAVNMTAIRATHVYLLETTMATNANATQPTFPSAQMCALLRAAQNVVAHREAEYRVDVQRIAGACVFVYVCVCMV